MSDYRLGIDHLTVLDLPPVSFVSAASAAGFTSVSLRTIHILGGEPAWADEPLRTEDIIRAADGMRVHAIEAVALTPGFPDSLPHLKRCLEQGAELGAGLLYCFADDSNLARCEDHFSVLAEAAREYGLRTLIEPMPYRAVSTVAQAAALVGGVQGAGLIVDTLHASRGGTLPGQLTEYPEHLLAVLQLCDAPLATPEAPSPSGLDPRLHEARFNRLLPGEGELPLAGFASSMPAEAVITVEAPAAAGDIEPMERLLRVRFSTHALLRESKLGVRQ